MINRTYIAALPQQAADLSWPFLDIVVSVPGSPSAPVGNAADFPPGTVVTTPPAGWAAGDNHGGAYFEVRSRALRIEQLSGAAGFTPRIRLGSRLSICALQTTAAGQTYGNALPTLILSASLAPAPGADAPLIFGAYAVALADPAYGPVIRLNNTALNAGGIANEAPLIYRVDFSIFENKDEDFQALGHA